MFWEAGMGQGMPLLCPAHLHSLRMSGHLHLFLPSPPAFVHLNWEQLMLSFLVVALPTSAACVDAASRNAACLALLPSGQALGPGSETLLSVTQGQI